jgi:hypothetical protein
MWLNKESQFLFWDFHLHEVADKTNDNIVIMSVNFRFMRLN